MSKLNNISKSITSNPLFAVVVLLLLLLVVLAVIRVVHPAFSMGAKVSGHFGSLSGSVNVEAFDGHLPNSPDSSDSPVPPSVEGNETFMDPNMENPESFMGHTGSEEGIESMRSMDDMDSMNMMESMTGMHSN